MAERLLQAKEKGRSRVAELYANVNTSIGLAALAAGYALSAGWLAVYGVWNIGQGEVVRYTSRRYLKNKQEAPAKRKRFPLVGNIFSRKEVKSELHAVDGQFAMTA